MEPGDTVMACSDGLWHYFSSAELGSLLARHTPRQAAEMLVSEARLRAGGVGDNLSLAILKVEPLLDDAPADAP
jgi:serine/threonine protein phosphatase PrpC